MADGHITRFRADPVNSHIVAAVFAGFIAGALAGISGWMFSLPAPLVRPYNPEVCELPTADPIADLIREDEAARAYL